MFCGLKPVVPHTSRDATRAALKLNYSSAFARQILADDFACRYRTLSGARALVLGVTLGAPGRGTRIWAHLEFR